MRRSAAPIRRSVSTPDCASRDLKPCARDTTISRMSDESVVAAHAFQPACTLRRAGRPDNGQERSFGRLPLWLRIAGDIDRVVLDGCPADLVDDVLDHAHPAQGHGEQVVELHAGCVRCLEGVVGTTAG